MEKKPTVFTDSRTAKISFNHRVPIGELFMVLEEIGPIVRYERLPIKGQHMALITFETAEQAQRAITTKLIKHLKIMVEKETQTDSIEENQPKQEIFSLRSRIPNVMKPKRHTYENEARLFCKIPKFGQPEGREERFLWHFNQFGSLVYHKMINDTYGRPYLGYVCYSKPKDAIMAVKLSHPSYNARLAEPRKMSYQDFSIPVWERQVYHEACGKQIERSIYQMHKNTCRIILGKETSAILKEPIKYEHPTKRLKLAQSAYIIESRKSEINPKMIPEITNDWQAIERPNPMESADVSCTIKSGNSEINPKVIPAGTNDRQEIFDIINHLISLNSSIIKKE